ncbi:MAG TPA: T9SS type A sorting domain-containing protein [bacterium]|nr:T9SS type A sorting domain-containing protein [bacterium]
MKRLFCVVFALVFVGAASAGEWHIETVDSEGYVGWYTSLALDSSDYPHISYYDVWNRDLKYTHWDGGSWQTETVDSEGSVGEWTSLALDSNDYPHISYYDYTNGNLKYARWDGSSWQTETIDLGGQYTSLSIDYNGYPCISYYEPNNGDLKYARWDGGYWLTETVDEGDDVGMWSSLAHDSSGKPHISYYDLTNTGLRYAYWTGSTWGRVAVDTKWHVGEYTSLALDSSGYPRIMYQEYWSNGSYLKYARRLEDKWIFLDVDTEDAGYYTSLALDTSDRPRISYRGNGNLRYASWTGSSWHIETVDSEGRYTSLALDSLGNPHISYYANEALKYAYWDPGPGVEGAEVSANTCDEGVLVGWTITGDAPASFNVLRSAGENEPDAISGALPGTAARWLDSDVEAGGEYLYWLEAIEEDGTVSRFGPTEAVAFPGAARELALSIYPSPVKGSFTVDYTLPEDGRISISLYDLSGRRVSTILDGEMTAGRHDISYDASALPPGVYLARLATDSGSLTRRVVIAR